MTINRRDAIRIGATAASGAMMASAAAAQMFRDSILAMPAAPAPARAGWEPLPATSAMFDAPTGVDPLLFARARAALDRHAGVVTKRDFIGIVDFARDSASPRFHLVHLGNGWVETHHVAHGRGSDPAHSGFVERFSNRVGSEASSNGAYTTGLYYHGKYGLSMRLHGQDPTNDNAEARAIVIHNAWYAEPDMIAQHGKLGRSEGCFAFSRNSQWQVMSRLEGGRLIYADKLS